MLVQHRGHGSATAWTRYRYAHHPFDVVGWDGCLYPYVFSINDFEPITGRLHQPPPVHQTFEGPNFVICSFVPRLFDYHPEGIPAPYNHANVDSDEVIFYTGGDFMSRKGAGIEQGSISLHPSGFTHGPQPGSVEASIGKRATDELAVMVDTFRPLELLRAGAGLRGRVLRVDLVGAQCPARCRRGSGYRRGRGWRRPRLDHWLTPPSPGGRGGWCCGSLRWLPSWPVSRATGPVPRVPSRPP